LRAVSLLLVLILVTGPVSADTALEYKDRFIHENHEAEAATAMVERDGELFISGLDTTRTSERALVTAHTMPLEKKPDVNFLWPVEKRTVLSTAFTDIAVLGDAVYASGASSIQTSLRRTGEVSPRLVKFPVGEDLKSGKPVWAADTKSVYGFQWGSFRAVAAATVNGSDEIYATGYAGRPGQASAAILVKYNGEGKLLWFRSLAEDCHLALSGGTDVILVEGTVYVAGFSKSADVADAAKESGLPPHLTLWRYDPQGHLEWMKTSAGLMTAGLDPDVLTQNGLEARVLFEGGLIYVAASKLKLPKLNSPGHLLLMSFRPDGKLLWETNWEGDTKTVDTLQMGLSGLAAGEDRLFVSAHIEQRPVGELLSTRDLLLLEVDPSYGTVLGKHFFNLGDQTTTSAGVAWIKPEVYVAGTTQPYGLSDADKPNKDIFLLKFLVRPQKGVALEIQPDRPDHRIVLPDQAMEKKRKRMEVALIAKPNFETATEVRADSLTLGRTGYEACWAGCRAQDVDKDGLNDLLCEFDLVWDLRGEPLPIFHPGDTSAILRGETLKGERILGVGDVEVLGPEEKEDKAANPTPKV